MDEIIFYEATHITCEETKNYNSTYKGDWIHLRHMQIVMEEWPLTNSQFECLAKHIILNQQDGETEDELNTYGSLNSQNRTRVVMWILGLKHWWKDGVQ